MQYINTTNSILHTVNSQQIFVFFPHVCNLIARCVHPSCKGRFNILFVALWCCLCCTYVIFNRSYSCSRFIGTLEKILDSTNWVCSHSWELSNKFSLLNLWMVASIFKQTRLYFINFSSSLRKLCFRGIFFFQNIRDNS